MANISVNCPNCNRQMEVPEVWAGSRMTCPACGGQVLVEKPVQPEPEPVPEPPQQKVSRMEELRRKAERKIVLPHHEMQGDARPQSPVQAAPKPVVQNAPDNSFSYCSHCGAKVNSGAVVCTGCGCRPQGGRNFCMTCGEKIANPEQMICLHCGCSLDSRNAGNAFGSGRMITLGQKSPVVAMILSFFILGAGQIYLGQVKKGFLMLFLGVLLGIIVENYSIGLCLGIISFVDAVRLTRKLRKGQAIGEWEFF